jgi:hypothetical protein
MGGLGGRGDGRGVVGVLLCEIALALAVVGLGRGYGFWALCLGLLIWNLHIDAFVLDMVGLALGHGCYLGVI